MNTEITEQRTHRVFSVITIYLDKASTDVYDYYDIVTYPIDYETENYYMVQFPGGLAQIRKTDHGMIYSWSNGVYTSIAPRLTQNIIDHPYETTFKYYIPDKIDSEELATESILKAFINMLQVRYHHNYKYILKQLDSKNLEMAELTEKLCCINKDIENLRQLRRSL